MDFYAQSTSTVTQKKAKKKREEKRQEKKSEKKKKRVEGSISQKKAEFHRCICLFLSLKKREHIVETLLRQLAII